ncbi:vesicle transport protein SFT2B, partial [Neltuma alba]|uniref:vesicle transport protein SFT2B n=1 Tax=Neltuma alba TaxID=207710 RepID=UPI0010A58E82
LVAWPFILDFTLDINLLKFISAHIFLLSHKISNICLIHSPNFYHKNAFPDFTNHLFLYKQRIHGFIICFVAGLTCTLLSMIVFLNPIKFGITFTLGNLLSLGSTAFLIGPKRQLTMMLDPVRIYATAIFIASIIIALICALYAHNKLLTLLAIILEFGALVWYSLSYIPFARSMVSKILVSCFDTEF